MAAGGRRGHEAVQTLDKGCQMNDKEFRAILDWMMFSDPWPGGETDYKRVIITAWLDREAQARGWEDWIEAFHKAV